MTENTQETQDQEVQQTETQAGKTDTKRTPLDGFLHHQRRAAEETAKALSALIPPDFREHSREARKEFLQSFKVLVDGARESLERELNRAHGKEVPSNTEPKTNVGPTTTGKNKVKVEVS